MAINPYANGSQVQAPFGDIYAVRTPKTDAAVNRLLQNADREHMFALQQAAYDKRAREARADALDKDLVRQMSGTRLADAEDISNAYNDYSEIKKKVLFDPQLQNDPVARARADAEAAKALTNYYGVVDNSKQAAKLLHDINKDIPKNYFNYGPDAHDNLQSADAMSSKEMLDKGMLSSEYWAFKEGTADLGKITKAAQGTPTNSVVVAGKTPDGLQTTKLTYKVPNSPLLYKDITFKNLSTPNQRQTFIHQFRNNVTEDEEAAVNAAYDNALMDKDKWVKWGVAPQPISAHPDNDLDRAVTYAAKKHFLDTEPILAKNDRVDDKGAIIKAKFDDYLNRLKAAQPYKKEMVRYRAAYKDAGGTDDTWTFEAADAMKDGSPEQVKQVFERLAAGTKGGFKLVSVEQPGKSAFKSAMGLGGDEGTVVVNYTKPIKNPLTGKWSDEPAVASFNANDPNLVASLAHLQGTATGIKAKTLNNIMLGKEKPTVEKPKTTKVVTKETITEPTTNGNATVVIEGVEYPNTTKEQRAAMKKDGVKFTLKK